MVSFVAALLACLAVLSTAEAFKLHRRQPVPLVEENLLLEIGAETMGATCKAGFKCPIVDGQCCANGESCCPQLCVSTGLATYECRQTLEETQQKQLLEAFMRKRELDAREDALAKLEQDQETKRLQAIQFQKDKEDFDKEVTATQAARLLVWQKLVQNLKDRVGELAKKLGVSPEALMAKDPQLFSNNPPGGLSQPPPLSYDDRTLCGILPSSPCTLDDAFAPIGEPFSPPRLEKWENRDICFLSGSIQGPAISPVDGRVVMRIAPSTNCLPEGGTVYFPANIQNALGSISIDKVGQVSIKPLIADDSPLGTKLTFSFSVLYSIKNGTTVMLDKKSSWSRPDVSELDRAPYLTQLASLCSLSGRIHQPSERPINWAAPLVANIPETCKPKFMREFVAISMGVDPVTAKPAGLAISSTLQLNGTVTATHVTTSLRSVSMSLDHMTWSSEPGTMLTLAPEGGWQPASLPTAPMEVRFSQLASVVVLSGVITGGKSPVIGMLPPNYRPYHGTLVFVASAQPSPAKIYVDSDGKISCPDYQDKKYVSLDGIAFLVTRTDIEKLNIEENDIDVAEAKRLGLPAPVLRSAEPKPGQQTGPNPPAADAARNAALEEARKAVNELSAAQKARPT